MGRGGRILRPEKKFFDLSITQTTINSVATLLGTNGVHGTAQTIVGIPQGTTESSRIGRKCTITNIYARLQFEFLADNQPDMSAATAAHETIRVMMFWDKQANGAAGGSTDILETNHWASFRNLANSKRFTILFDRTYHWNTTVIAAGNGTANDSSRVTKDYLVKISKKVFIPIEYLLTTGALTSNIATNNIGMIVWGKHGGTIAATTSGRIRIRFIDY